MYLLYPKFRIESLHEIVAETDPDARLLLFLYRIYKIYHSANKCKDKGTWISSNNKYIYCPEKIREKWKNSLDNYNVSLTNQFYDHGYVPNKFENFTCSDESSNCYRETCPVSCNLCTPDVWNGDKGYKLNEKEIQFIVKDIIDEHEIKYIAYIRNNKIPFNTPGLKK